MSKYEVRFCSCGRVHFIENEKVESLLISGKSVLHICNNCGIVTEIYWQDNGDDTFDVCSRSIIDENVYVNDKLGLIIASSGERVIMGTGEEATSFCGGVFIDYESNNTKNIFQEEFEKLRRTVDINKTINSIRDEEKLECMSHYAVDIHWVGTKFEKEYNK